MHLKKLPSLSFIALLSLFMLLSCGDDSESKKKPSFDKFEYASTLRATIASGETESDTEGYVTVDKDGKITIETLAGTLTGEVEQTEDGYIFTITEGTGSFADVTNITGAIMLSDNTTFLSGTNPGGSGITVVGENAPIPVMTDGGWDNLQKATALFTHSEPGLLVSITVNGETFSGLNAHYHPGGLCDSYYALSNSIPFNADDKQSQLFCNSGTLKGLDGNPVKFTDCNTIRFVLNKQSDYTYTATWSNGNVTTGHFKTPGGGGVIAVCPSVGSGGSGGSCNVSSNTFKVGSSSMNVAVTDCNSDGNFYYIYAESANESEVDIILPSKPTSNASYTIIDGSNDDDDLQPGQAVVFAYTESNERDYYSTGGGTLNVVVKDGNVSVNFCGVNMRDFDSDKTVKASGKFACE